MDLPGSWFYSENDALYAIRRPDIIADDVLVPLRDGRGAADQPFLRATLAEHPDIERLAVQNFLAPSEWPEPFEDRLGQFPALTLGGFFAHAPLLALGLGGSGTGLYKMHLEHISSAPLPLWNL